MGDTRFDGAYHALASAEDRASVLRSMSDAEVVHALAAASKKMDAYLANVLATEALNRQRRLRARLWGAVSGLGIYVAVRTVLLFAGALGLDVRAVLMLTAIPAVPAVVVGAAIYWWMLRRAA